MKSVSKAVLPLAIAGALTGCGASREIQADFVTAQLIKVDTAYRYPNNTKILTWKCQNNVEFVTYVPVNAQYEVGTRFNVLLTK